jgi:aspartyl-tRNA(Asn)/glutamyl-tRNA(Gln) amidotransferase subunit C
MVEYVANLSRIELTEEEKRLFTTQLDAILEYIEKLNRCDVSTVTEIPHASPHTNLFREDKVTASLPREEALANAPDQALGYYKVPRIIE